jgi:curli production assembly/transport component CsgG
MMMFRFSLLLALSIVAGCAQIPKWSDQPEDCSYLKNARDYICVDEPEVVDMPAYVKLLEVPPATQMPVVAVYGFKDLTGQRKARDGIADFSTAVTQGGTEMLIDALKTAGKGTWFRQSSKRKTDC